MVMPSNAASPPETPRGGETIGAGGGSKLPPGLYLVATPIGNLGDVSARAIATLRAVDRIAAEDTRVARRLLSALGIAAPRLERHDDHSDEEACGRLVAAIAGGEAVALVSDAGMPVIADPGFRLVRAARAAGLRVTVVPGPSAPLAALALSGLPSDRFLFAGFLPSRRGPRRAAISGLAAIEATLLLLEAPQRVAECLADLAELLGGARDAVLAREITKMFEEVRAGTLAELAAHYAAGPDPRGEVVLVVGPPVAAAAPVADEDEIDRRLAEALDGGLSLRDAVEAVAGATGTRRREVYARALATRRGPEA
jgi:16S rRNA (cytidine1402-2'-O)-methyltransferase